MKFLGPGFEKIFAEGMWQPGIWVRGIWQQDTPVDPQTRLDCVFVDYYADDWKLGRDIEKYLLISLMNRIEEKLRPVPHPGALGPAGKRPAAANGLDLF